MGSGAGDLLDGSADTAFRNGIALRLQLFIRTTLYRILTLGMYDHRALLRLFRRVSAYLNQGLDHPFERIDLIVPDDQAEWIFRRCKHFCIRVLIFERTRIVQLMRHVTVSFL